MRIKTTIAAGLLALAAIGGGTALKAQAATHSVTLNWTAPNVTYAVGYNVYRCPGTCAATGATWTKIIGSINQANPTWVDTNVVAGSTYSYYATAYDATGTIQGESVPSNIFTGTIPTNTPPTTTVPPVTGLTGKVQ